MTEQTHRLVPPSRADLIWTLSWLLLSWLAVGVPSAWALEAFQEANGQVVIEVEHYDQAIARSAKAWVQRTSPAGYSGAGLMKAEPNTGLDPADYVNVSPELIYRVQFATTGTYRVWVRGYNPGGGNNSVHAGLDGVPAASNHLGPFTYNAWKWENYAEQAASSTLRSVTLTVSKPGLHTLHLWMAEDGSPIDKVLLRTSSSTTAPSGTGPAESQRVTVGTDTTPPTGSITINSGAGGTNTPTVTLTLSAMDNAGPVAQMQFSNDGTPYSTPEAYATTKNWTLSSGDGTKTVWVKFKDAAGNWSVVPASDTITLDTTAPDITIVSPKDGDVLVAPLQ